MRTDTIAALLLFAVLIALMAYVGFAAKQKSGKQSASNAARTINEHTTIGTLLSYDSGVAEVLRQFGMHCLGCASSQNEELWQACSVHSLDTNEVLAAVMDYFNRQK